jgi:hypothetical protein
MRESRAITALHRRSKPPRQSLRYMYRIELATLEMKCEVFQVELVETGIAFQPKVKVDDSR